MTVALVEDDLMQIKINNTDSLATFLAIRRSKHLTIFEVRGPRGGIHSYFYLPATDVQALKEFLNAAHKKTMVDSCRDYINKIISHFRLSQRERVDTW